MKRNGILAGGNFIIDHVKIIDAWPQQDMLATILREASSNGGGPYNVLKDLAAMKAPFPLSAIGLVGSDANGDWILRDCQSAGIVTAGLSQTSLAPTSYTDAMTVEGTGRRTFFHQRGANALLGLEHFDFTGSDAKIFHLGYLMLLDELDRITSDGETVAAKVLARARAAGLITTVDIVSTDHPNFRTITEASLPYVDCLVINEVEAGKIVGHDLRKATGIDLPATVAAAQRLLDLGVHREAVIHFVEGAVAVSKDGNIVTQGSLELPPEGFIAGATGAGDAFAAGYLYGLHEDWDTCETLKLAVTTAAVSLTDPTPSGGVKPLSMCRSDVAAYPFRQLGQQAM